MTRALTTSAVLRATPGQVWTVLSDWNRGPEWLSGIDSMTAPVPVTVGSVVTFVARGAERSSTITALETGRLVTMTSTQGPVTADYTYTVSPESTGSRVDLVADVVVRGPLKLISGVIRSSIAKEDGGQLEALRKLVDG